ncbi:MAG: VWA domain-containing protein [Candidatus Sumerlaeia bacterium]|nr:VWA domain-containing protein [Candidatus Sumerlaeia bacterium]
MNLFSFFLNPAMLGFLALLPLIVLMYLLKLKRRPMLVPSTLLWRRAVEDLVANSPFQKLRNNLLMWLQLLALLLLVLALARPVMNITGTSGESIILMVDLSASMQARESDGRTRLDHAKDAALRAVEEMSTGNRFLGTIGARDEMMILGIANRPIPLQPMTSDQAMLRAAIRSMQATDTQADLRDTARILEERTRIRTTGDDVLFEPNPRARVVLISDGVIGAQAKEVLAEVPRLDYIHVGETTDNVGITLVDVRESFSGSFQYEVFTSLLNSSDEDRTVYLELVVDNEVLDVKRVDLPAEGSGGTVFLVGEDMRGLAVVRLANHTDALSRDDVAYAVIAPPSEMRVLLVSRGNPFLERVLAVDPRVRLSVTRSDGYTSADDYDMVVFDRFAPAVTPPGNIVYINDIPRDLGFELEGDPLKTPRVMDWSRVHSLTPQFISFDGMVVGESLRISLPPQATSLVQTEETDLISYYESDNNRIVVIGFDITRSYWPIDASFPVFFTNLLDEWSRVRSGAVSAAYRTGSTIAVIPPREATTAILRTPSGERIPHLTDEMRTMYLTETTEAGIYTLIFDTGWENELAVNLSSTQESNIVPQPTLELPGGRQVEGTSSTTARNREIWFLLVLVILGVLMLEWYIYTKRSFA